MWLFVTSLWWGSWIYIKSILLCTCQQPRLVYHKSSIRGWVICISISLIWVLLAFGNFKRLWRLVSLIAWAGLGTTNGTSSSLVSATMLSINTALGQMRSLRLFLVFNFDHRMSQFQFLRFPLSVNFLSAHYQFIGYQAWLLFARDECSKKSLAAVSLPSEKCEALLVQAVFEIFVGRDIQVYQFQMEGKQHTWKAKRLLSQKKVIT